MTLLIAAATAPCLCHAGERLAMLGGRVLNSDAFPPEGGTTLELRCPDGETREAHTDSQGWFRFAPYAQSAASHPPLAAYGPGLEAPSLYCDLWVSAPGYRSRTIVVHLTPSKQLENLGIVYLNRAGASPAARISVAQLQIPERALREYGRGTSALKKGALAEAASRFDKAARAWPKFAAAWIAKGHCSLQAGRLAQAGLEFERALAADPRSPQASYGLAVARFASGEIAGSEQALGPVPPAAAGDFSESLHLLALIRVRQGRVLEGIRLLERYIAHPAAKNREAAAGQLLRLRAGFDSKGMAQ